MFNLSKRARFGIYVLVELTRSPESQRSTEELAQLFGVSANHLSKVMQRLAREGWVVGTRGPSGGYQLAADPKILCMADVIELFEGSPRFDVCSLADRADCAQAIQCEIKHVVREIEEQSFYTLKSVTIHLLAHPSRTKPEPQKAGRLPLA